MKTFKEFCEATDDLIVTAIQLGLDADEDNSLLSRNKEELQKLIHKFPSMKKGLESAFNKGLSMYKAA